MITKLEK